MSTHGRRPPGTPPTTAVPGDEAPVDLTTVAPHPLDTGGVDARGLWITAAAFIIWGLVPLYWHALREIPSIQIIAHRIVWSSLLVIGGLLLFRRWEWLREIARQPKALPILAITSVLIAFNWGLYVWAVNSGHVVETSLGYFINPLLNVLLGVAVLGERLRIAQWVSVGFAAAGVAWLTLHAGTPPWIALGLAASFGLYGLLRKIVGVDPVSGLGVESLILCLPALAIVLWAEFGGPQFGGPGGFLHGWGWRMDLLVMVGGAITALPLIGFAYGVRRIPLTVVGLLQYIAPTIQLLLGVLVFGEAFGTTSAIGFGLIWLGLAIFAGDGVVGSRQRGKVVPAPPP